MGEGTKTRRFPPLDPELLSGAQRLLAEELLRASNGYNGGPIPLLLRSPEMARRLRPLIIYFARETRLPKRLCELAILIQARAWRQGFEWWAHRDLAIHAGLPAELVADLEAGRR